MRDLSGIDIGAAVARESPPAGPAQTEMSALLRELLLAEATALARDGRHAQALDLLGGMQGGAGLTAAGYDLMARIHAQRGELPEARDSWRRALESDPGNREFKAGLSRIEKLLRRSPLPGYLLRLAAVIAFAAILAFIAYLGIAAIENEIAALKVETARLASLASELGERPPPAAPAEAERPDEETVSAPDVLIDLDGISTREEDGKVWIEFEEGLFARSATLTPDASSLLARLGAILAYYIDEASIEIVGHTDDVPPLPGSRFEDNYCLAVARAVAVAEHISSTAKIPLSLLTIRGEADFNTPFPNNSRENRLRNRTVVIRIGAKR